MKCFGRTWSITRRNLAITSRKFEEGTVLKADLLEARMRSDQAEMDLVDAQAEYDLALINLHTLIRSASGD